MNIQHFFDPVSSTLTYLIWDADTKDAVVIDPVLDFNGNRWEIDRTSFYEIQTFIRTNDLTIHHVMETHVHADHMTGAQLFKNEFDCKVLIHEAVVDVQRTFQAIFNLNDFQCDGSDFDGLLKDRDVIEAGSIRFECIHTPGHTPACVSYLCEDMLFTGDALFHPSFGTGRCDFPGGNATQSYDSIKRLYQLPDETRIFVGHAYPPKGKDPEYASTIGESKSSNKWLTADTPREEFVVRRTKRDAELPLPNLLYQALQINIKAGKLPDTDSEGSRFLKMPLFEKA